MSNQPAAKAAIPAPKSYPSEASKWRHLIAPYVRGNVVEIASGGDPIVPHALQIELSEASYNIYNSSQKLRGPVQWRDDNAIPNALRARVMLFLRIGSISSFRHTYSNGARS